MLYALSQTLLHCASFNAFGTSLRVPKKSIVGRSLEFGVSKIYFIRVSEWTLTKSGLKHEIMQTNRSNTYILCFSPQLMTDFLVCQIQEMVLVLRPNLPTMRFWCYVGNIVMLIKSGIYVTADCITSAITTVTQRVCKTNKDCWLP